MLKTWKTVMETDQIKVAPSSDKRNVVSFRSSPQTSCGLGCFSILPYAQYTVIYTVYNIQYILHNIIRIYIGTIIIIINYISVIFIIL